MDKFKLHTPNDVEFTYNTLGATDVINDDVVMSLEFNDSFLTACTNGSAGGAVFRYIFHPSLCAPYALIMGKQ